MSLEALIEEFLLERGALSVGIATAETLSGSPPSADITYRMEEARSAVSFTPPSTATASALSSPRRTATATRRTTSR